MKRWMSMIFPMLALVLSAPFAVQAQSDGAGSPGEAPETTVKGVDGNVAEPVETPHWQQSEVQYESDRQEPNLGSDLGDEGEHTDESADVGDVEPRLYTEDLFSDAAVVAKGLGQEAGWNIETAERSDEERESFPG